MIRTGIGGWNYAPWRGTFYPQGLRQADELAYAAARLGTIEINATYYRLQKPESFAAWRDAAPEGFVYAVKGSRYCISRKALAEGEEGLGRFFSQGLEELGEKLGPILWQFAPTRPFDRDDVAGFLDLLPGSVGGIGLRHVLEVRHESFACREFVELARSRGVAIALADHDRYPQIADRTAGFVYVRLMRAREENGTGYPAEELEKWARFAREWSKGRAPGGLTYVSEPEPSPNSRDVFIYMIDGAKLRAPAAAMALAQRL